MDSKSWNGMRIWLQAVGKGDAPGLSELTDSVYIAGLDVAGMSQEEKQ